jgi:hypothetical protein
MSECYYGCEKSKVWWHYATVFNLYYFYYSFIQYNHTFIYHLPRPVLLYPHRFLAQQQEPPRVAESRFELGPALQATASRRTNY